MQLARGRAVPSPRHVPPGLVAFPRKNLTWRGGAWQGKEWRNSVLQHQRVCLDPFGLLAWAEPPCLFAGSVKGFCMDAAL